MKKLFYTFIFAAITAVSVSACTEQEIKPKDGGVGANDCGQPGLAPCKN